MSTGPAGGIPMMVNEPAQVEEMLIQKLREANLANVLRADKTQVLDMEDYLFLEVVLADGAELHRVAVIVDELQRTLGAHGTRVDTIVRALWEVTEVRDHGTAYGKDGAPRAAHEFYITLKSGMRFETVVVEIGWGSMESFRRKLDAKTMGGKADENTVAREIVKIIRKFVARELQRGGASYWDPLRTQRLELNEPAIAFISAQRE
jgi:hypothetical protein